MTRRKLSDAQIEELCRLREGGWGYKRLAARFCVSAGAVHYQCLRNGAFSPHQRAGAFRTEPDIFTGRDGRMQRRFTQAEDGELIRLEKSGLNYRQIAEKIGRTQTSVRIRLMTLAMHEEIADRQGTRHG